MYVCIFNFVIQGMKSLFGLQPQKLQHIKHIINSGPEIYLSILSIKLLPKKSYFFKSYAFSDFDKNNNS